jgi:hypothetical protein
MKVLTMEEKIGTILVDLAAIKTDVAWLKRLFTVMVVGVGAIIGVDITGMV